MEYDVRKNRSIKPKIRWKAKKLPDAWQGQNQVLEVQQALIYPNIVSKARDPLDPGLFFVRAGAGDRIFARTGLTNRGRCGTLCMISCI